MIVNGYAGFRGFRGFAGGGRGIFAKFTFAESWSSDDFETDQHFNKWVKPYLDQVGRIGMTWEPPSPALAGVASSKYASWLAASDLGDPLAADFVAKIKGQMDDLTKRADQLSVQYGSSRSEAIEVQRYDTFDAIVKIMKQVAASKPPSALLPDPYTTPDTSAVTGTRTTASNVKSKVGQAYVEVGPSGSGQSQALVGSGTRSGAGAGSDTGLPGWVMPVGIGAGVLLLGGITFAIVRKKSKK